MIPPVPIESLPQWVQDKMKLPPERFEIGDKVYGFLYDEPNGTIIDACDAETEVGPGLSNQWVRIGWNLNPENGKYRNMSSGAPYCVKYPDET